MGSIFAFIEKKKTTDIHVISVNIDSLFTKKIGVLSAWLILENKAEMITIMWSVKEL